MKIISILAMVFVMLNCSSCSESNDSKAIRINQSGLVYQHSMQFDSAIVKFREAAAIDGVSKPTRSTILRNLAICFVETEQLDSSKYYYEKAASAFPVNSYTYLVNTADIHILDAEYDLAIQKLEQAFELMPDKLEVNNTLGILYLGEFDMDYYDPQKALRYNLKADAINNDRNTQFVLGKNYFQLKRYPEAIKIFTSLYNSYPDYSDYLYSLVLIQDEAGNTETANQLLQELKQKDSMLYEEYLELNIDN